MKLVGRLALGVAWMTLALLISALVLAIVPTLLGREALVVVGGSMGDAVPVGSVAITEQVPTSSVQEGDVISFRRSQSPGIVTHRVFKVKERRGRTAFVTKGDANPAPDAKPIVADGDIHVVRGVIPKIGYVVNFGRSPLGFLGLIVIPIAMLLIGRSRPRRLSSREAVA